MTTINGTSQLPSYTCKTIHIGTALKRPKHAHTIHFLQTSHATHTSVLHLTDLRGASVTGYPARWQQPTADSSCPPLCPAASLRPTLVLRAPPPHCRAAAAVRREWHATLAATPASSSAPLSAAASHSLAGHILGQKRRCAAAAAAGIARPAPARREPVRSA